MYCENTKKKTTINGDKHWTKTKEGRKKLSKNASGAKNINHKSRTTELERKQRSPKCIEFYKLRYPDISLKEQKKMLHKQIEKTELNTPKTSRPQNIEYWTSRGYSEEDAQYEVKERQAVGRLDKFIERYGKKEGKERWEKRQEKWLKNFTRSNFSKISQHLFWDIFYMLPDKIKKEKTIYFATYEKNNEHRTQLNRNFEYTLKLDNSSIKPDFFIKEDKKIIEFDGTYWHRNTPQNKKREAVRDQKILNSGYRIHRVSENEYKKNPDKVLQDCINFIKEND